MSRDLIVGTLDTGCRLGEMLKIQNRHVLWDTHQIVIPAEHTKDAESRRIPFEPKARLAQLLKRRRFLGPKAFVFGTATGGYQGTIRTAWESLVLLAHGFEPTRTRARGRVNREQLAGIDLHWHDLRHEAACRRLAGGLDLRAIQLLLGHADLKTTQPYLNVTDEELRKTMQQKAVDPKIISPGLSAGSASRNGCAEFRLTRCRQEAPLPLRRYVCMLESYV